MRIVEPGHVYAMHEVGAFEGQGVGDQIVQFVRRRGDDGQLLDRMRQLPGVLSQELLRVLIDRVRFLADEDPCVEDVEIIGHLRVALRLFEARAARKTIDKLPMPELADACPICHHLLCAHRHPERLEHDARR